MEQWQINYITANGPKLLDYTICNTNLLFILKSKEILGAPDLNDLDAARNSAGGRQGQTSLLYDIIQTRCGAYEVFVQALHETKQSGARDLLMYGYIQQGTFPPFEFGDKVFTWNSNHFSLSEKILSKLVYIQDQKIQLAQICQNIDTNFLNAMMERTINNKSAFELLNDKVDVTLICNVIPKPIKYYIHRTLTRRIRLNLNVFKTSTTDIFVVKGITLHQFTTLAHPNFVDRSSSQLENPPSVRHILCEWEEDFETICKNCPEETSAHFLSFQNEKLHWVKTHGNINQIQCHVHENQEQVDDETFANHLLADSLNCQPVCISDSPGMGKTILLANIANKLKAENNKSTFVFFFVLSEFVQYLPTKVKDITADKIREIIATQVTKTDFGKELVQHLLTCTHQEFELCFDGFDEVLNKQEKAAKQLLKIIRSEMSNVRLHVTTRPHMLQQLEEILCVLGYNILPFEMTHQINFLVCYWQFRLELPTTECKIIVESFAKRCLETLNGQMLDKETDIAGVPLQCRLLGEIYEAHVKRLLSAGTVVENESLVNSLHQLYQRLMTIRFEGAKAQEKSRNRTLFKARTFVSALTKEKTWTLKMKCVHYLAAVELLFPDFMFVFREIFSLDHYKYLERRELHDIGIIEGKTGAINTNYRFSHRTFAEFLFSEMIANIITSKYKISQGKDSFLGFLLYYVFKTHTEVHSMLHTEDASVKSRIKVYSFDHSVINYFINAHLKDQIWTGCSFIPRAVKYINTHVCTHFYEVFIACALSNFGGLFHYFVALCNKVNKQHFHLPVELPITAAKYSDFELNRALHNLIGDGVQVFYSSDSDKKSLVTSIQVAVQRGHHPIVQVLANKYGDSCISKNLLHICLVGSSKDNSSTISSKLEIIKFILEKDASAINRKLEADGTSPILQPFTHIDLIEYLLRNNACADAVSPEGGNILHMFFKKHEDHVVSEPCLVKLLLLLKKYEFKGYNVINNNGDSPLSLALQSTKISHDSLQFFQENNANFDFKNKKGENILFAAVKNKQSIECIKQLITYAVCASARNNNGQSLLHAAVSSGHVEAVKFLLNDVAVTTELIKCKDSRGNTPLHAAYAKNELVYLLIQNILITHGSDLNNENYKGFTPVEYGFENAIALTMTSDRLQFLERNGYDLSSKRASKLLRAIVLNKSISNINDDLGELIQLLISHGAKLSTDDDRQYSVNIKAMKTCLVKIAQNIFASRVIGPVQNDVAHVFHEIVERVLDERDKISLSELIGNDFSVEFVISVLLYLKDKKSFQMLRKAYQLIQFKSTRFITSFEELVKFYELAGKNICVILTDNIILTVAKVQDAIDSSMLVVDMRSFSTICSDSDSSSVVVIVSESSIFNFLHQQENSARKLICVCKSHNPHNIKYSEMLTNVTIFEDKYKWQDLTPELQNKLLQIYNNNYKSKNDGLTCEHFSDLSLCEILTYDVLPTDFLIPMHVTRIFKKTSSPIATVNASDYNALLLHAFEKFCSRFKYSSKFPLKEAKISEKNKNLLLHGPTATYLAALWISRNFDDICGDGKFIKELFSCSKVNLEIVHDNKRELFRTYEFDNWLLLYFLNKCITSSSSLMAMIEKCITPVSFTMNKILHSCVHLNSPNLLSLFDYEFFLSSDTPLVVASIYGNVHFFSKTVDMELGECSIMKISKGLVLYKAVEHLHLEDVLYFFTGFADIMHDSCSDKDYLDFMKFCIYNTFYDDEKLVKRKLVVLKCLVGNSSFPSTYFEKVFHIALSWDVHMDLLKYIIVALREQSNDWHLPEDFLRVISSYMSVPQINELAHFAVENNQQHLILGMDHQLIAEFANIFTETDFEVVWNFATCNKRESAVLNVLLRHFHKYTVYGNELHIAIRHGNAEALEYFILHGADVTAECVCCGEKYTKLCFTAAFCNILKMLQILLNHGASFDASIIDLLPKLPPKEYLSFVKVFLFYNKHGYHMITSENTQAPGYTLPVSMETVKEIARKCYTNAPPTCILCPAIESKRDLIELKYISRWIGLNFNYCHHELPALHTAVKHGQVETVEFLLGQGFNVYSKCTCCKKTALDWCYSMEMEADTAAEKIISLLLARQREST